MTNRAHILAIATAIALAGGSALADEQTYDLSGFKTISVSAGISAKVTVGSDYSVRAESTAEELERLDIHVRGDELSIGRKNGRFFNFSHDQATVYVTLPALSGLDVSSGADAEASGVSSSAFALEASSGASIIVSGECSTLSVDVSSGADIDAEDLICETANADASSGASAEIHASKSIVADASSGGSIRVHGSPTNVNLDRSSGGSISIRK